MNDQQIATQYEITSKQSQPRAMTCFVTNLIPVLINEKKAPKGKGKQNDNDSVVR